MNPETELLYQTVVGLYQGLLGRAPEIEGLEFWKDAIASGALTFQDLIDSFVDAPEFDEVNPGLGEDVSPEDLATIFYANLLDRAPDAEGLKFWTDLLADGTLTPGTFTAAFLGTPEATEKLGEAIQNYIDDAADGSIDNPENEGDLGGPDTGGEPDDGDGDDDGDGGKGGGGDPDTTAPTVAINLSDYTVAENGTATVTFTFSEVVEGFTVDDVSATGGTLSDLQMVSATEYKATFTANDAEGAASVAVADHSYTDLPGNIGAGASIDVAVTDADVVLWDAHGVFAGGFDTLQDAVAAAGANYTIDVQKTFGIPPNLSGDVVVDVPGLTINAAGAPLDGGVRFNASAIGSSLNGMIISGTLDGASNEGASIMVLADDVTLQGNDIHVSGGGRVGIVSGGGVTGLLINGNTIHDFNDPDFGVGIYLNSTDTDSGNVIINNTFDGNNYGLVFEDGPSATVVSGNAFTDTMEEDIEIVFRDGTPSDVDLSSIITGNTLSGTAKTEVAIYADEGATVVGTVHDDYFEDYSDVAADNTFDGGAGNDVVVGGLGNDVLSGGDGNDVIWGDDPSVTGTDPTNFGDDTINGGSGLNVIILGTEAQDIQLGGQDTVIVDHMDGGANLLFNFNFGPADRYDDITAGGGVGAGTTTPRTGTNDDLTFDIVEFAGFTSAEDLADAVTITYGDDNGAYEFGGGLAGATFDTDDGHSATIAGREIYTGNETNGQFEIFIQFATGTGIGFANAHSIWGQGKFLDALDSPSTSYLDGGPDAGVIHTRLNELTYVEGDDPTTELVTLTHDQEVALLTSIANEDNFTFVA